MPEGGEDRAARSVSSASGRDASGRLAAARRSGAAQTRRHHQPPRTGVRDQGAGVMVPDPQPLLLSGKIRGRRPGDPSSMLAAQGAGRLARVAFKKAELNLNRA